MFHRVLGVLALGVPMSANAAGNWYEGGTLHNATLRDWSGAVTQNKMATMADMVIAAKLAKRPMDVVDRAVRTASCVDEVARDKASQGQDVATVAAVCMMDGSK